MRYRIHYPFSEISHQFVNMVQYRDIDFLVKLARFTQFSENLLEITYLAGKFGRIKLLKAMENLPGFNINHAYLGALQAGRLNTAEDIVEKGAKFNDCMNLYDYNSDEYKFLAWFKKYHITLQHIDSSEFVFKIIHSNGTQYVEEILADLDSEAKYVSFLCNFKEDMSRQHFDNIVRSFNIPKNDNCYDMGLKISNRIISQTLKSNISTSENAELYYWLLIESQCMMTCHQDKELNKDWGNREMNQLACFLSLRECDILPYEIKCMIKNFYILDIIKATKYREIDFDDLNHQQIASILDRTWVRAFEIRYNIQRNKEEEAQKEMEKRDR